MADYTRLIEFKVKDTELNRSVKKLSKTLDNIDKSLVEIDKKLGTLAKGKFKELTTAAEKAAKATEKINRSLKMPDILGFLRKWESLTKKVGGTAIKFGVLDTSIRAVTGAFGKQTGLVKAITRGHIDLAKVIKDSVTAHRGLAAAAIASGGAVYALAAGAPAVYNLGKSFRQLTYDITQVWKAAKQGGAGGVMSMFPKGSILGQWGRGQQIDGKKMSQAVKAAQGIYDAPASDLSQRSTLESRSKTLAHYKQEQKKINSLTWEHLKASARLGRAQQAYNIELTKTKLVQAAVTADIWLAQKAWQGVLGTLRGATGLLGGLLGGKAGGIGRAAGVIGISRTIELLVKQLDKVNIHFLDGIKGYAKWAARGTEAFTAINLAYTGLTKVLSGAQWVTGAVQGFIAFEKAAAQSIWGIERHMNNAFSMFGRLARELPQLASAVAMSMPQALGGMGLKGSPFGFMAEGSASESAAQFLSGGKVRGEEKRVGRFGPSRAQELNKQLQWQQQLLKNRNTTAQDYQKIQRAILRLENQITKEEVRRAKVRQETYRQMMGISPIGATVGTNVARSAASRAGSGFASWNKSVETGKIRADIEREKNLQKILRINKKLEASGKAQLSTWRFLSQKERDRLTSATALAAQRERETANPLMTGGRFVGRDVWSRYQRMQTGRSERRSRFNENLMLGAGFPLLFGGGVGSVAGGVLGAASNRSGKGFGAQILFSALGQQLDAFVVKIKEVGDAIRKPTENIESLIKVAGLTDTPLGNQIKQLEQLGLKASAAALATQSLTARLGKRGMANLEKFSEEWLKFANHMEIAKVKLMGFVAGPLSSMVSMLNKWEHAELNKQAATQALGEARKKFGRPNPFSLEFLTEGDKTKGERQTWTTNRQNEIFQNLIQGRNAPRIDAQNKITRVRDADVNVIRKKIKLEKDRLSISEHAFETRSQEIELERQTLEIIWQIGELEKMKEGFAKEQLRLKIEKLIAEKALGEAELANHKKVTEATQAWKQMNQVIRNDVTEGIKGLIKGTATWADMLSNVADKFLDIAINQAFYGNMMGKMGKGDQAGGIFGALAGFGASIFGGSPRKAAGGPVTGGNSYVVGERGPELFVPRSGGNIVPNNAMGNVTVNVDASGSAAQGDGPSSEQLGQLIGAAIQNELIRQKRPGGLLG